MIFLFLVEIWMVAGCSNSVKKGNFRSNSYTEKVKVNKGKALLHLVKIG